ncbi:MAG: hypothetical protein BGN88_03590 [Clostridiales bacterium 43-6]|nr:MAG: hypothetical protein BGN88_03590 [Clostridiales bacterium 43-6]
MMIKLCGIRRPEDILYCNEFRPDCIGFVLAESKRRVTPEEVLRLKEPLHKEIKTVGVFVNEEFPTLVKIVEQTGLDILQLHGDESADYVTVLAEVFPEKQIWKAVRVTDEQSLLAAARLPVSCVLGDAFTQTAYGGTGHKANWDIIQRVRDSLGKPLILAGGLNAETILPAIRATSPFGVDISSGIETDGVKDRKKIKTIMTLLRSEQSE